MSNKDSAATCQHANLMPVTSQGSVYVSRCTSCNEVRVDSDWQKDSAAEQRCDKCGRERGAADAPLMRCEADNAEYCSFSEAAASEGVPERVNCGTPPDHIWVHPWREVLYYSPTDQPDYVEYARVRASVDGAGLGPFDDSQPVLAALSRLMDDGDATDNQRRTARMALKELAKRSPVDEAAVRRAAERIKTHIRIYLSKDVADLLSTHDITEIITTELQKGK